MISKIFRRFVFGGTSHGIERKLVQIRQAVDRQVQKARQTETNIDVAIASLGNEKGALLTLRSQLETMQKPTPKTDHIGRIISELEK